MKLLLTAFTFLIFSASYAQKNQKAIIKTQIYCDHCKECETCGQLFSKKIYKIDGVKMYELDADKNQITVYYNSKKTDLPAIRQAISKLGYDADDVAANPEAYELLDGCCKK